MLKKVFSVVLCLALTCSMLSAFAITISDITTTTTYKNENEVTVTTTVMNATENATYTYLAHKTGADLAALQSGQIVYVDEEVANGTTVEFRYTADDTDIGSTVRVSGVEGDTLPALLDNTHTVAINNGEKTDVALNLTAAKDTDYIFVPVSGLQNMNVAGVTVNGVAASFFVAANGVNIVASALKVEPADDKLPAIVITTGDSQTSVFKTAGFGIVTNDTESTQTGNAIIAMGRCIGEADVTEFGIQFCAESAFTSTVVTAKALGKGTDGYYAVKVVDYNKLFNSETVYARAYYKTASETVVGKIWKATKD